MTSPNQGSTNSIFFNSSDVNVMAGVTQASIVEIDRHVHVHTYAGGWEDHLCTYNEPGEISIAWVDYQAGTGWVRSLKTIYLSSSGRTIAETHDVVLPVETFCVGLYKVDRYNFRILMGTGQTWTFYWVDVSAGTCWSIGSYTFTWVYSTAEANEKSGRFFAETRSGTKILGLQLEQTHYGALNSWPTTYYKHVFLAGVVADMSDGSFSYRATMLDVTRTLISDHRITGGYCCWHYGDAGFFVRACMFETLWDQTQVGGYQTWYLDEMRITEYVWQGFSLGDQTYGGTVLDSRVYAPHLRYRIAYYPPYFYPNTGTCGYAAGASGLSMPLNSFTNYANINGAIYIPDTATIESLAPRDWGGYTPNMDGGKPLSETGNQLNTSSFEMTSDPHAYLADIVGIGTQLFEAGYTIYTFFNKLDSSTGNILCWASRDSDNMIGIIIFDQTCTFVQFIPVAGGAITGSGGPAYLANGFLIYEDWCYFICAKSPNVMQMIIENN